MRNKNENNSIFIQNEKAESLYNRILLLINGLKRYLNEVGGKLIKSFSLVGIGLKRYLNEVGGKQVLHALQ